MVLIFILMLGAFFVLWGVGSILGAVFWWDKYSKLQFLFPLAKHFPWQIDVHDWIRDAHGDKGVRIYVLITSLIIAVLGIWLSAAIIKDSVERVQIADFPQAQKGDTVPFAGGELTLEEIGKPESFTAQRFNLDKNRYEEVEVKADMYGESLLMVKATLINSSSDMLSIVHEDLKFYAKPSEEGNDINGRSVVDGYLYHDNPIELAVGESVPVWFWLSLTKEEQQQPFWFVLQYGNTGCILGRRTGPYEIHIVPE